MKQFQVFMGLVVSCTAVIFSAEPPNQLFEEQDVYASGRLVRPHIHFAGLLTKEDGTNLESIGDIAESYDREWLKCLHPFSFDNLISSTHASVELDVRFAMSEQLHTQNVSETHLERVWLLSGYVNLCQLLAKKIPQDCLCAQAQLEIDGSSCINMQTQKLKEEFIIPLHESIAQASAKYSIGQLVHLFERSYGSIAREYKVLPWRISQVNDQQNKKRLEEFTQAVLPYVVRQRCRSLNYDAEVVAARLNFVEHGKDADHEAAQQLEGVLLKKILQS